MSTSSAQFSQNYFELFALPQQYQVDSALLSKQFRALQQQFHPDRYADKSAQDKRMAMQFASHINAGYQTLKSPLHRAQYLLELLGVAEDTETRKSSDMAFLMQQMTLREQLADIEDEADPLSALDALQDDTDAAYRQLQQQFADAFAAQNYVQANDLIGRMQFYLKLLNEIEQRQQELDD